MFFIQLLRVTVNLRIISFYRIYILNRNSFAFKPIKIMNFKILQTWTTDFCADCVEWCPVLLYQHFFVCGTYELINETSSGNKETIARKVRVGQVMLFSLTNNSNLCLHSVINCAGILDLKWCPHKVEENILLVSANSNGSIILYSLQNEEKSEKCLKIISLYTIEDEDILVLSIDWFAHENDIKICASDSKGSIIVLKVTKDLNLILLHKLCVHDYEVWAVIFDFYDNQKLYSGGDDSLLKIIDLKNEVIIYELKEHTSGVTSLKLNHFDGNILATGSYDETLKIWDIRQMKKSLSSIAVGGGIWRIKWDPFQAENLLVAAMYSGVHLFKYKSENYSIKLECELKEHESIAYGIDYCHLSSKELQTKYFNKKIDSSMNQIMVTASCSFYDKKLCISILEANN